MMTEALVSADSMQMELVGQMLEHQRSHAQAMRPCSRPLLVPPGTRWGT
jgi:hypothetical protein